MPMTVPPKNQGQPPHVPLTAATTAMLRDYLAAHQRGDDLAAPLFPNVRLRPRHRPAFLWATRLPESNPAAARRPTVRPPPWPTCRRPKRGAAGARLGCAATTRHLLQSHVSPSGVAGATACAERRATGAAKVPRPPAHLREFVHRGGTTSVGGCAIHGPREGHHDARGLRAPLCGRPHRRDGCPRGHGDAAELRPERCATLGLGWFDQFAGLNFFLAVVGDVDVRAALVSKMSVAKPLYVLGHIGLRAGIRHPS